MSYTKCVHFIDLFAIPIREFYSHFINLFAIPIRF